MSLKTRLDRLEAKADPAKPLPMIVVHVFGGEGEAGAIAAALQEQELPPDAGGFFFVVHHPSPRPEPTHGPSDS